MNELKRNRKSGQNRKKEPQRKRKKNEKKNKVLIIIAFILVILSTLFIIRMNDNGWTYGGFIATVLGHDSKTKANLDTLYIVVTGESQNLTDSILVCAYNPKSNKASMVSIPRDTFIGDSEKNAKASDKINTLYAKSPEKLVSKINSITGLNVKYYINIDTKGLRELIDEVGGVYYDVPIDMDYDDDTQDLHIHLKAGYQLLDGDKSEQLVRFRHNNDGSSYPAKYGDNDIGRMKTQRGFIEEVIKQVRKKNILLNIGKYIKIIEKNVETNFDINAIKNYIPYAVDFNFENLQSAALPGEPKKCNGVWLFIPDKKATKTMVDEYFIKLKN